MRPAVLNNLLAPSATLKGIGPRLAPLISRLCGPHVIDLLWHFPVSLIDRRNQVSLSKAEAGHIWTGLVRITEHSAPKTRHKPYRIATEADDGTTLILTFFKYYPSSLQKALPVGAIRAISGKLERFNNTFTMSHPDYIAEPEKLSELADIEPVYPLCAGVTKKLLTRVIRQCLPLIPTLDDWTDPLWREREGLPDFKTALTALHSPKTPADLLADTPAHRRLAYDELLANQLTLAIARERVRKQAGRSFAPKGTLTKALLKELGFDLTNAQKRALSEIATDQSAPYRMLRLLQGDVGCGKTIVAFLTMLNAVECGAQAAIMAPTEILAKQHLESMTPWAEKIGIHIELLTGKIKGIKRRTILERLQSGQIDILIGTHALFTEDVSFKDLGCVVVDEQHRFGVNQRLSLSLKGSKADVLVMTATPIPRTLILTQYGDMDYSKIDEVPKGRKPVDTRIVPLSRISDVVDAVFRKIQSGCRAYWVCPLIEESEKTDLAAAEERFESLKKIFGSQIGLIHGKMKEKEKDEVMTRFKDGKISLLVATTVIEVGVNVPEATLMVIEQAERFGLAQLHQLRGRIKRGFEASTCLLLYGYPLSTTAHERLKIMKESEDGFMIAEKDLELRGGGEILGTKQSGFGAFRLAEMPTHQDLLYTAHKDAALILQQDPNLQSPRGTALRTLLYLFERDEALKTYLAG